MTKKSAYVDIHR